MSIKYHVIVPERREGEASTSLRQSLMEQSIGEEQYDVTYADGSRGKKEGLRTSVANVRKGEAEDEWIVMTDADCTVANDWIEKLTDVDKDVVMVAGSVRVNKGESGFWRDLETVEWLSLQGVTRMTFPMMCNGANLAVRRRVYEQYLAEGADRQEYASGDDMFLLEYCKGKGKVAYRPECVVETRGSESIGAFVRQRLRWAGKTGGYKDVKTILAALTVFGVNAALIALASVGAWHVLLAAWGAKSVVDFIIIAQQARRFDQTNVMWCFPIAEALYPIYAVGIGLGAQLRRKRAW